MNYIAQVKIRLLASLLILFTALPFIIFLHDAIHGNSWPASILWSPTELIAILKSHALFFLTYPIGMICFFYISCSLEPKPVDGEIANFVMLLYFSTLIMLYTPTFLGFILLFIYNLFNWLISGILHHYAILLTATATITFFFLSNTLYRQLILSNET